VVNGRRVMDHGVVEDWGGGSKSADFCSMVGMGRPVSPCSNNEANLIPPNDQPTNCDCVVDLLTTAPSPTTPHERGNVLVLNPSKARPHHHEVYIYSCLAQNAPLHSDHPSSCTSSVSSRGSWAGGYIPYRRVTRERSWNFGGIRMRRLALSGVQDRGSGEWTMKERREKGVT
jgi:hypothetical protein